MLTLTIRSDKPEAELGLYEAGEQLSYFSWLAHRELAETIHLKIESLLEDNQKTLEDIGGLVVYKGPGSFTGLRIGLSVANALALGLGIPIVATSGSSWIAKGISNLRQGINAEVALPKYGAPPNITQPKH